MPIYEYECLDCRRVFELIRPMSQADAPAECSTCQARHTRRKISRFFAESGGRAVAGGESPSCGSCQGGNCSSCGH